MPVNTQYNKGCKTRCSEKVSVPCFTRIIVASDHLCGLLVNCNMSNICKPSARVPYIVYIITNICKMFKLKLNGGL